MGKLSDADAATLKRLQAQQDAPDDDTDEVWVQLANGHSVRLTGDRARAYCRKHGIDPEEADESTQADPVGKKTPAKKAAGKKPAADATDDAELEDAEELEADPPAVKRVRMF